MAYLKPHARSIFTWEMERLCDYLGCNEKKLSHYRDCAFCERHLKETKQLEQDIKRAEGIDELDLRLKELKMRKIVDPGQFEEVRLLYHASYKTSNKPGYVLNLE
jgi:hypothetical protein